MIGASRCVLETREYTEKYIAEFLQKPNPRSVDDLRAAIRRTAVANHATGYAIGFAEGMNCALELVKKQMRGE
jgi:hypothetical protein